MGFSIDRLCPGGRSTYLCDRTGGGDRGQGGVDQRGRQAERLLREGRVQQERLSPLVATGRPASTSFSLRYAEQVHRSG